MRSVIFVYAASGVNVASGENHNQTVALHCCPYFCSLRTNIKSTMVDYGSGPVKESIDNTVFIFPGIIVICLVSFFAYKLFKSLREKEKAKEEKKKMKQQRKEKEQQKKQKKKL